MLLFKDPAYGMRLLCLNTNPASDEACQKSGLQPYTTFNSEFHLPLRTPENRTNEKRPCFPMRKHGSACQKSLLGRCRRARWPSDCNRIAGLCRAGGAVSASAETIPYIFHGHQPWLIVKNARFRRSGISFLFSKKWPQPLFRHTEAAGVFPAAVRVRGGIPGGAGG